MSLIFMITALQMSIWAQSDIGNQENLKSFWNYLKNEENKQNIERNCEWELQTQSFPIFCQKKLEEKIGEIGHLEEIQSLMNQVDLLCRQNIGKIQSLRQLEDFLKSLYILDPCRVQAQQRLDDLKYKNSP